MGIPDIHVPARLLGDVGIVWTVIHQVSITDKAVVTYRRNHQRSLRHIVEWH